MTTTVSRREFTAFLGAGVALAAGAYSTAVSASPRMHGLIGKITAVPGKRDALAAILLEGVSGMPGCLSYVVAVDPTDDDALWITEVWKSAEAHRAALDLESVRAAIEKGRPLIAGFGERFETTPIGGHGLVK